MKRGSIYINKFGMINVLLYWEKERTGEEGSKIKLVRKISNGLIFAVSLNLYSVVTNNGSYMGINEGRRSVKYFENWGG